IEALKRPQMRTDFDIVSADKNTLQDILKYPGTVAGIIPGSDSSQNIRSQIGRDGLDALRNFVMRKGGALAGFCAGGYLMGTKITYGACFPKKHQRSSDDNLNLIDATFYGPLSHLMLDYAFKHPEHPYISLAHVKTAREENLPVVYWHGGVPLL